MDWKYTLKFRAFTLLRIPLIAFIGPVVEEINTNKCIVRVPFRWRIKNQIGSMFFGVITTMADTTHGFLLYKITESRSERVVAIIKEFQVNFLKRIEADAYFECADGAKIAALFEKAALSGAREEEWMDITVTVPSKFGSEPVAKCRLLVSMRKTANA